MKNIKKIPKVTAVEVLKHYVLSTSRSDATAISSPSSTKRQSRDWSWRTPRLRPMRESSRASRDRGGRAFTG
jgi:hypothetical protein